ncbi:bifunctional 2-polyprenyl-6-hydroxyphenol methylase/3-demethylubiquinol 3-O-methyltransferase UbiG [Bradyrhizobium sp. WD16]|uniref:class I SAM-dependent methyltransferase n=1 Tax=Bradyrhizobium sp. WD16 TaxID=1521768 RepID=UPI0020A2CDC0|nr:class I SAM-dependent methyltransferase [Bradyrhizobium sp. WD16]UTD29869.1 SAM-dependent methyltransferase [Bradyrhizobium sp. WD16]
MPIDLSCVAVRLSSVEASARRHAETGYLAVLPPGEARDSLKQAHDVLQRVLPSSAPTIYEAGGGSTSFLPPSVLARADITVVDIDEVQLTNNGYARRKILGDIQACRFPRDSFDLIICDNVIEHLSEVERAFRRFNEALRRGGLIMIGAPNPNSLSGFVTRVTPHAFHVWYYRNIMGVAGAGKPGEPPFPVHFHPLVEPERLKRFARSLGYEVLYDRIYESPRYPELRVGKPAFGKLLDVAASVSNAFLFNTKDVRRGDYHLILRKL